MPIRHWKPVLKRLRWNSLSTFPHDQSGSPQPNCSVFDKENPGLDDILILPERGVYWRSKRKGQKIVDEFQIQVMDQPAEVDWQWLEESINRFNMQVTGYDDYRPLAIFMRDSVGLMTSTKG